MNCAKPVPPPTIDSKWLGNASLKGIQIALRRLTKIKDPVLRYTLFSETLGIIFEMGTAIVLAMVEEDLAKDPENGQFQERVKLVQELHTNLMAYLDGLTEWIQTPMHSPDHPYGQQVMASLEKDFHEKSQLGQ